MPEDCRPRLSRWDGRGNVRPQEVAASKNKNVGREAMKSFQVAEFNAPLKEVDQETPQPTGTQVLIKVKAAGVCHSDLHIWEGGYDLGHGRKPLSLKDRGVSLPRTMGHETAGKGAIVVDIDARKREAAQAAGALATVDGKAPDALEQLVKIAGEPIRAVIDLVGNAQTTQLGFDCLTKGGKLVIVGLFGGGAPWALPLIPIKAITIQGSYVGNLRETQELLDLVRTKNVAPIPVTPLPLAKANEALLDLQKGKLVGRAILTP